MFFNKQKTVLWVLDTSWYSVFRSHRGNHIQ